MSWGRLAPCPHHHHLGTKARVTGWLLRTIAGVLIFLMAGGSQQLLRVGVSKSSEKSQIVNNLGFCRPRGKTEAVVVGTYIITEM